MLRGIIKWSVIGALGTVLIVGVVGPGRVKGAVRTAIEHVRSNADDLVDTRIALREQVSELREEYPERVAEIRIQLREIDRDLAGCSSSVRTYQEMLALAESDSEVLRTRLDTADRDADGVTDGLQPAFVEFRGDRLGLDAAYTRAAEISEKALTYQEHLGDLQTQERLLNEERKRLEAQLVELKNEQRQFEAEVNSIGREIDSLNRKEKLVEMAKRRHHEQDDLFAHHATSLQALKERIASKKIKLEEELRGMRSFDAPIDEYEARARLRIAASESQR